MINVQRWLRLRQLYLSRHRAIRGLAILRKLTVAASAAQASLSWLSAAFFLRGECKRIWNTRLE